MKCFATSIWDETLYRYHNCSLHDFHVWLPSIDILYYDLSHCIKISSPHPDPCNFTAFDLILPLLLFALDICKSLSRAWSQIVYSLIPNVELLETQLDDFSTICAADEVVLFERATFLVISHISKLRSVISMHVCELLLISSVIRGSFQFSVFWNYFLFDQSLMALDVLELDCLILLLITPCPTLEIINFLNKLWGRASWKKRQSFV